MENGMEVPLKQSRYTYRLSQMYSGRKYTILYDRLLMNIIFLDDESLMIYDKFKAPLSIDDFLQNDDYKTISNLVSILLNQHFLVPIYDNEQWKTNQTVTNANIPKVGVSYLVVTRSCNLRCKYCFLTTSKENPSTMSIDTAKRSIEQIMEATISSKVVSQKVILYGGEPFVARRTVSFSIQYIRKLEKELKENNRLANNVRIRIAIISNGTLIDEEIAHLCKLNNVTMSISMDGAKELHDKNRVYVSGSGTYEDVLRGLRLLQHKGIEVTASTTITKNNVEKLEEVTDHLVSLGFKKIGYNILMAEDFKDPEIQGLSENTALALLKVYEKYRKKDILIYPVIKQANALFHKNFQWSDCAACSGQLTISPEGKVGVCQAFINNANHFKYSITNESTLFSIIDNSPLFNEWRRRSPINMEQCTECEAISICGGGCPYNAFYSTGSIWNIDKMFCPYAKSIINWGLRNIFNDVMKSEGAKSDT
ncbi:MAG: radical SAM protein [Thermoplasmatales archaeon]|nr:radical SAM protein [Thermoplasmatales archaeon]MCW6171085.1 radical SAM protein [Thermoplasmatales archaeon]